ncbi:alpha/beta hydrolase [Arcicella rosea]|uniref:Pimeloyl-ACP methyl ester carboxylesterase n=1 Tax=Arcicella rosea TaxID=502909 RepID=A0A841ERV4_9BACT|nr:alpha/beta hydrolase [Arcicella rosea]MBB6005014.1 pimeloyl-ACP methyl ester carboxylesterase [Arcicella rosea]
MKSIYIFSGLGADERVFKKLDFSGFDVTFIHWVIPNSNETIETYALRLTEQIKTNNPILIGLSFGGMMATEVAKLIDTEKIIIIASAKTQQEIPFYYRFAGMLKLHRLIPTVVLKTPNFFSNWLFGTSDKEDKEILASIMLDTDEVFLTWAIDKIVNWKNDTVHKNLKHIHGTADRILPYCLVKSDIEVNGGGHLMTLNKAEELTKVIRNLLDYE